MVRRKLLIGTVVVVLAGAVVAGSQTGWPSALFGSSSLSEPLGPHIEVSQITSKSATPYQIGADEYVNSRLAWKGLTSQSRARLIRQLHAAELNFKKLGRKVFPPERDFTVRDLSHGSGPGSDPSRVVVTARYAEDQSGYLSEDFGPTAFGDHPLRYGTAAYAGASGQWSWIPCASVRSATADVSEAILCGGQALAVATHLAAAGMSVISVEVYGDGAALAAQPAVATFTNQSGHAENLTVTATAAEVTASVRTSPASIACTPASLLYSVTAPKNASPQLASRSQISLSNCLDSLDALIAPGGVLKIISDLRTWASFARDVYDTVTNINQYRSSDALRACAAGRMLSYIGGILSPVGVPTCTPVALPTWTGPVPAGQTVQFAVTPFAEEYFFGEGEGDAMLLSFIHLHIAASRPGSAPCTQQALTNAVVPSMNAFKENRADWKVADYVCQDGYAYVPVIVTQGLDLVAILKQQGLSWTAVYGPTEGLCIEPVDLQFCPHHKLPLPLPVLRTLLALDRSSHKP
jgi:hypothetical protein